jgi:exodeoxyribonuclease V alpha subunit
VAGDQTPLSDHVVTLDRPHRFGPASPVADVADAIRLGDADAVIEHLRANREGLTWIDPGDTPVDQLPEVVDPVLAHARRLIELAEAAEVEAALDQLSEMALLCAHRRGPVGVSEWVSMVERRTRTTPSWLGPWFPGRPVMVTTNDYRLRLFNGDIGVTVRDGGRVLVAFPDPQGVRLVGPGQLPSIEGVQAMTIHKSQGSQFKRVMILVPPEDSRLLTRELLYTAVTRAESDVTLVGSEQSIRDAVTRPVVRASGLRNRLATP